MISSLGSYFLCFFLGIAPSVIWLTFYLHKDAHPEPKKQVFKIFLLGALMGPLAVALQYGVMKSFSALQFSVLNATSLFFLNIIIFAPLSEEFLKYAVVRWGILKNPAFDEPLDAMLYLIISALGFAALENLLNIFYSQNLSLGLAFSQSVARFLSATFLHTLSSGILGYFLARSLLNLKKRRIILAAGFLLAVGFHSFYNYLAWLLGYDKIFTLAMALFLAVMAGLVSWQFRILNKQLSICKIKLN